MPRRKKTDLFSQSHSAKYGCISFGPGARILSEDHFLRELAPLGVTRRSLRALCRALSVPMIEVGSVRFIDPFTFRTAFRAILRIGQPDFYAPGSASVARGDTSPSALDPAYVAENLEPIITELVAASRMISETTTRKEIRTAAQEAARRMALAGIQRLPIVRQTEEARRAIVEARRTGLIQY